ncbi:unnamed protein product [Arctia plantaginis]|uniref:Uncharacterized protein n=1 Tax=Arctia plantaginis TaxID=874455 RepID=A0A8S1BWR8_ARCPL|nr:unnamed protein product [Arctia plantaginis]
MHKGPKDGKYEGPKDGKYEGPKDGKNEGPKKGNIRMTKGFDYTKELQVSMAGVSGLYSPACLPITPQNNPLTTLEFNLLYQVFI